MSGVLESPEEDTGAKVMNILNKKLKLSPHISIDNIDRLPRVGKPGGWVSSTPYSCAVFHS